MGVLRFACYRACALVALAALAACDEGADIAERSEQCGGWSWKGPTTCEEGFECGCKQPPCGSYKECLRKSDIGKAPTLFCFAVVTPNTYEPGLVAAQYELGVGMFACDAHVIISNVSAKVLFAKHEKAARELKVWIEHTPLYAKTMQGPAGWDPSSPQTIAGKGFLHKAMKHLANTPIFIKVWDRIFAEGLYAHYDWTLKLDVDSVIIPYRVKLQVKDRPKLSNGEYKAEYLLNVVHDMYGNFLHGPVEAVSKMGMKMYQAGTRMCQKKIDKTAWGEDFYLNKCLAYLEVPGVTMKQLLYDIYEWGEVAKYTCDNTYAVFHPRKNITGWLQCLQEVGWQVPADLKKRVIAAYSTEPVADLTEGGSPRTFMAIGAGLAMVVIGTALVPRLVFRARSHRRAPLREILATDEDSSTL